MRRSDAEQPKVPAPGTPAVDVGADTTLQGPGTPPQPPKHETLQGTPVHGPRMLPPGHVISSRYRVDQFLGAGGMGSVYSAIDLRTGRALAIKFLSTEIAVRTDEIHRFSQEARAAASINHPGIVEIIDLDRDGDLHYLVMERLVGEELAARIRRASPLSPAFVAELGAEMADAVGAAHEQKPKIVHRDLKPQNVFLARRGREREVVKILDFGIAKLIENDERPDSRTRTAEIRGTPLYMSPEQIESFKTVDERTDIYAMGVILYEALAGRTPYSADSLPALYVQIATGQRRPLREARPDAPRVLTDIVERAMATDRERRYQTAADMRAALLAFLAGVKPEPLPRAGGRRRVGLWAGVLGAVLLAGAGVVWIARRAPTPPLPPPPKTVVPPTETNTAPPPPPPALQPARTDEPAEEPKASADDAKPKRAHRRRDTAEPPVHGTGDGHQLPEFRR